MPQVVVKEVGKRLEFAMRKKYCPTKDENTSENSSLSFKNRTSCTLALGHVDLGSKQAREHRILFSSRKTISHSYTYNCTFYKDTIFTKDLN